MSWHLINSESQNNKLQNKLFMGKAECSASLDTLPTRYTKDFQGC